MIGILAIGHRSIIMPWSVPLGGSTTLMLLHLDAKNGDSMKSRSDGVISIVGSCSRSSDESCSRVG